MKKSKGLKIAGIILIVIQCLATTGSLIGGNNPFRGGFLYSLGFFALGIIGIILLIIYLYRNDNTNSKNINNETQNNTETNLINVENEIQSTEEQYESKNDFNNYLIDKKVSEKYKRMFKRPFDEIQSIEIFMINNYKCYLYKFKTLAKHLATPKLAIGGFCYFIKVKTNKKRYFASEYSFDNTYVLCEWVFEGEKELKHINYGAVVSSNKDMFNHLENIKQKLKEILA